MDPIIEPFPRATSVWQDLGVIPRQPARAGENALPPGGYYPPVAYDDFDFWIALEGQSVVELLSRTWSLDAGTCLLLPPMVSVAQRVGSSGACRIAYFHFDLAIQGTILRDARSHVKEAAGGKPTLALPGLPTLALLAPLDASWLADRLLGTARRSDDVAQLQSTSFVTSALAEHRLEAARPTSKRDRGRGVPVVDAALEYLESNIERPVFVEDIARHVRLSPTHLTRLFRAQLQETPMQALARMRLARSLFLLRDPSLNISEVASQCGFESLSFFTRVFTRSFGRPPSTYRRGLQNPR